MFVKNCPPCGRLFASPAEEGEREGGTLLADGLSPLLLLLLFLPLFLPPAHTQLLYIQPSSLQPRGFHDRKRALSLSSPLSPQIGIPPGRLTPLSPFSVSWNFGIHPRGYPIYFVSFIPFFVKCKHAFFSLFCLLRYVCGGIIVMSFCLFSWPGGGKEGGYYLEVQPEAHSAHLGRLSIHPQNDRRVCAF